jgi:hypothetical protein
MMRTLIGFVCAKPFPRVLQRKFDRPVFWLTLIRIRHTFPQRIFKKIDRSGARRTCQVYSSGVCVGMAGTSV